MTHYNVKIKDWSTKYSNKVKHPVQAEEAGQTKLNIQFKRKRQVKKPLCKGENVFIFFTPKQIVLKPHQEIEIDMLIQIEFSKHLIPEFVLLPSLTRMEIEAEISNNE